MKSLIASIAILCMTFISYSQNVAWKKCFGGSKEDMSWSIINSNDNAFIIVGNSKSNDGDVSSNNGSGDFWVIKIDTSGAIIWEKSYGLSNYERPFSITTANDGGYIIAGYRNSIGGDAKNSDFWVVKISEEGELIWDKLYGGSDFDNARHIMKTNDNGYIVSGTTTLPENFHRSAVRLIKIDNSGNIIWEKTYLSSSCINFGSSILTPDNGIIFIASDCTTANTDYIIVKLDENGNMEWRKEYGGSLNDTPSAIKHCKEGGYIIVGSSSSNNGDVINNHGGAFDFWVIKISNNGNLISSMCYGGSKSDRAYDVIQNNNNEFIVVGYSNSNDGDVTNNTDKTDYWIINIDTENNLKWEKCIGDYSGEDIARSVIQASDKSYLIAGYTDSYEGVVYDNHGDKDFWVIKLNENFNFINNPYDRIECNIYPNPTDKLITIDCENIQKVEIIDFKGETVLKSSNNLNLINLSMLSNGLYFIKVKNDRGVAIQKIVLE